MPQPCANSPKSNRVNAEGTVQGSPVTPAQARQARNGQPAAVAAFSRRDQTDAMEVGPSSLRNGAACSGPSYTTCVDANGRRPPPIPTPPPGQRCRGLAATTALSAGYGLTSPTWDVLRSWTAHPHSGGGCRQADRRKIAASQTLTDSCGQVVWPVPPRRIDIARRGRSVDSWWSWHVWELARTAGSARWRSVMLCRDRHPGLLVCACDGATSTQPGG